MLGMRLHWKWCGCSLGLAQGPAGWPGFEQILVALQLWVSARGCIHGCARGNMWEACSINQAGAGLQGHQEIAHPGCMTQAELYQLPSHPHWRQVCGSWYQQEKPSPPAKCVQHPWLRKLTMVLTVKEKHLKVVKPLSQSKYKKTYLHLGVSILISGKQTPKYYCPEDGFTQML